MGLKTPIFDLHQEQGAKIVDFGGWDMPIHYGSQVEEHHAIRNSAGVCDVSHMTILDLEGPGSTDYLRNLLSNDVSKLSETGKALYSGMLNESGCVIDDLIVYRAETGYRIVVNCATREKDLVWMNKQLVGFECQLHERPELAILAIQGPESIEKVKTLVQAPHVEIIDQLKPFVGLESGDWFIARTGYTGEKGVEIMLPAADAQALWQLLMSAGVKPVGLGARDTLRLEAGMNLYGSDMDETVTPYESNMAITVVLENHDFIGKQALESQLAEGIKRELVGLVMLERGVLRGHYPIFEGDIQVGEITSGAYSPTLGHSIALARINSGSTNLSVEIRNKRFPVVKVNPPFARNGKKVFKID